MIALFAYNPEQPLEANLEAMEQSLAEVASVAVTWAVRDTTIDGIAVDAGAFIGLLEDKLAATGPSAEAALRATLDLASMDAGSIVYPLPWGRRRPRGRRGLHRVLGG